MGLCLRKHTSLPISKARVEWNQRVELRHPSPTNFISFEINERAKQCHALFSLTGNRADGD